MNRKLLFPIIASCLLACSCAAIDTRSAEFYSASQATQRPLRTMVAELGSYEYIARNRNGYENYTEFRYIYLDQIGATVLSIDVRPGQEVKVGDVLCEIKYNEAEVTRAIAALEDKIELAEAAYTVERDTAARSIAALEQRAVDEAGRLRLQRAEYQLMMSEKSYTAQLEELREQLAELLVKQEPIQILSEMDGTVEYVQYYVYSDGYTTRTQIVGSPLTQRVLLLSIVDKGAFELIADIARSEYYYKQKVMVNIPGYGTVEGYFIDNPFLLNPAAERSYPVIKLNISEAEAEKARSNSFQVSCLLDFADNVILVPREAVFAESSSYYVYIVENGIKRKRYVGISSMGETKVVIKEGLAVGQIVSLE